MPLRPSSHPDGGWYFDFPQPNEAAGHVHYVTFRHGPLTGKSRIVIRFRLEAGDGVKIVPRDYPTHVVGMLTAYFQRAGDNWSGRGEYETYRWYATPKRHRFDINPPGEYELVVGLDEKWTAVESSSSETNSTWFNEAIRYTDRVGFVLGGGTGYGHGVFATGPARLVVTDFRVE